MFSYVSVYFLVFLAIFFALYFLMPNVRSRQVILLAANIVFYKLMSGFSPLVIIFLTSVIVYFAAIAMGKRYVSFEAETEGMKRRQKAEVFAGYKKRNQKILYPSIAIIIAILIYTKVGKILEWNQARTLTEMFNTRTFLPVLGISYYTFSSIAYLADVYLKKASYEKNYLELLLCMTYFPHIVEGPISKYPNIFKQLKSLSGFSYERFTHGMQRMVYGVFKKLVVAERLSMYTTDIIAKPAEYAGVEVIVAVVLNAFQIYADFSGCMEIVLGISEAIGITLDENFRQPFFSKTAAEYWRRWHMTLGVWFKDYIYMPIVMNPKLMKKSMQLTQKYGVTVSQIVTSGIPLLVVWFLTGMWHGTGSNYVAWGFYWGLIIVISSILEKPFEKLAERLKIDRTTFAYQLFQMLRTFLLFVISRIFSCSGSIEASIEIFRSIFRESRVWELFDGSLYNYGLNQKNFYVALVGILIIWLVDIFHEKGMHIRKQLAAQPLLFRWIIYFAAIYTVIIFGIYGPGFNVSDFVYRGF